MTHKIILHLPDIPEAVLRILWEHVESRSYNFFVPQGCVPPNKHSNRDMGSEARGMIIKECDRRYAIWVKMQP